MLSNFSIFSICAGCKKRKLFVSRKWIKLKKLPPIRPNDKMCNKCLLNIEKSN